MGRKPSVNLNLPTRMRARKRGNSVYYYFDGRPGKDVYLGTDYVAAVQKWAALNTAVAPVVRNIAYAISQYRQSPDFTTLAPGTQADYGYALDQIGDEKNFGPAPLDQIRPSHVVGYLEKRSKESRHRALREVAVLGMVMRYARAHDWTTNDPVSSVKRGKLPGRKAVYIEDDVLQAVHEHACQPLKDAMDLAYLIGQRPGDVLRLTEANIKDGVLQLRQAKTGAPIRIRISGELETILNRIMERKRQYPVRSLALLVDERGKALSKEQLRGRFDKARILAGNIAKDFQFRDIRAKSATDLREQAGIEASQALLGHASITMTEHYTRQRKGRVITKIPAKS